MRIGIELLEQLGGCGFFQDDGCHEVEHIVPLLFHNCLIDEFVQQDCIPSLLVDFALFKRIAGGAFTPRQRMLVPLFSTRDPWGHLCWPSTHDKSPDAIAGVVTCMNNG
jgi:hypothetical protein